MSALPQYVPDPDQRLRLKIEQVADQLCQAVDGDFNFVVKVQEADDTIDKLVLLVNFALDSARRSVASLEEVRLDLQRMYEFASRQAQTVNLLMNIGIELSSILDLDELFTRLGASLHQLIDFSTFSILLLREDRLEHRFSLSEGQPVYGKPDVPLNRGLVGYAATYRVPVFVPEVSKDPRYIEMHPETRSEIAVPLIFKDELIGVLDIEHTELGRLTSEDVLTLTSFAAQIAVVIANATLHDRIRAQERQLQRDLAAAHELQMRLLPKVSRMLKNGRSVVRCIPARMVGGDFYGTIPYLKRGVIASVMADVSGKGAAAAVYAALANGFLHSCAAEELDPNEMLKKLNQHLIQLTSLEHFVAMLYSTWDERERVAQICNAGLPVPLLCRCGEVQPLPVHGMPLGLLRDSQYEQVRVEYRPGDTVLFCTDGVIEAFNPEGEEFGSERLGRVLCENAHRSPEEIVDSIIHAARQHCRGESFMDDLTVGVLSVA